MGYWNSGEDGSSLHLENTGLIWGDAPADLMDLFLDKLGKIFQEDLERYPTLEEVIAGVKFSYPTAYEDEGTTKDEQAEDKEPSS